MWNAVAHAHERLLRADGATVSLGHKFSANPLALAAAYAGLANDGTLVTPRWSRTAPTSTKRFVGQAAARSVLHMLEAAVSNEGTGKLARVKGMRIAGKTGTADLERGMRYASFVGIFPADAPRYVVLVGAVTREGSGPRTAAPRFASVVERAFR